MLGSKVSRWLAQACLCHRLMMAPLWWRRRRALRLNHTRTALYYTYSAAAREGAAVCAAWKKCRGLVHGGVLPEDVLHESILKLRYIIAKFDVGQMGGGLQ